MNEGWQCPQCRSIYSPTMTECWRCNASLVVRSDTNPESPSRTISVGIDVPTAVPISTGVEYDFPFTGFAQDRAVPPETTSNESFAEDFAE